MKRPSRKDHLVRMMNYQDKCRGRMVVALTSISGGTILYPSIKMTEFLVKIKRNVFLNNLYSSTFFFGV